ncbi:MAG: DUF126 domain-containing protein [Aigarchaeota archaeon]|nr:DUF126 domain-containing protein [Aigarchaeota archaeon]MDW7986314.1 DUF126 domain-containing protein [Nitrososphaerota archaeon]
MKLIEVRGRIIKRGEVCGEALKTVEPISFFGGVDPETGVVVEKGHQLEGRSISGKILVFPCGKGSTVGSYILYRLKKNGKAPLGIINEFCEPIVAVGAIISNIPTVDKVDISLIEDGDMVEISEERVLIKKKLK